VNVVSSFLIPLAQADVGDDSGILWAIVVWLFIGLVAGFLASQIINKSGEGMVRDIILGLIGSVVGGFIFHLLGIRRDGSIVVTIVVATLGAILVLVVYHKMVHSRRMA
jgi:uncharacterized membrane protein YeaQ/YmgE (transglycosylase-associated protein family)